VAPACTAASTAEDFSSSCVDCTATISAGSSTSARLAPAKPPPCVANPRVGRSMKGEQGAIRRRADALHPTGGAATERLALANAGAARRGWRPGCVLDRRRWVDLSSVTQ